MNKLNPRSKFRCAIVAAASAVFAIVVTAEPVRADHVEHRLGALLGGVVGGTVGSTIGKGSGRSIAIGVGSALGALYGGELAGHHHRHIRRHTHYAHPRHFHSPSAVTHHPSTAPIYVQPTPIYTTPPVQVARTPNTKFASARRSTTAGQALTAITECRQLEGGLAPVYACRNTHGGWKILR